MWVERPLRSSLEAPLAVATTKRNVQELSCKIGAAGNSGRREQLPPHVSAALDAAIALALCAPEPVVSPANVSMLASEAAQFAMLGRRWCRACCR